MKNINFRYKGEEKKQDFESAFSILARVIFGGFCFLFCFQGFQRFKGFLGFLWFFQVFFEYIRKYSKKIQIHSYIFEFIRIYSKKQKPQFIRIYPNSFIYINKSPIHSYIFEKNHNSFLYMRIQLYILVNRNPIYSYMLEFLRIYSKKSQFIRIIHS